MVTLDELAIKHHTDKRSEIHNYTATYEPLLQHLRDEPMVLLELGWGGHEDASKGGESARMWRDYFPNATIIVIDNESKHIPQADIDAGIVFRQGSQADHEFLNGLADEFGNFDVIVDDASHLSSLTIRSWEILYPRLKSGGIYIVEDTHMSYHAFYYGKSEAHPDPDGVLPGGRKTWNQYAKRLTDETNFKGRDGNDQDLFSRKYWLGFDLDEVSFKFNLTIIRKR